MANSWTKNLAIDGYTVDCSASYEANPHDKNCPKGMLQTAGDGQGAWAKIVGRVREKQPQVVLSGEGFGSWQELIHSNSDVGGQGFEGFHTATQAAVTDGDASNLETLASVTGADAATVLCYLNPYYDGQCVLKPGQNPFPTLTTLSLSTTSVNSHLSYRGSARGHQMGVASALPFKVLERGTKRDVTHQCPLDAEAGCSLLLLTWALLMTSS